jgi:Uma2 family endonuclease
MYQTDPPRPVWDTMPTMYDLPSEDPEEPGLPDEFHCFQPQLLRETFQTPVYPADEIFIGTDINLYYDGRHPLWQKRPDWFAVLGVPRSTQQGDMRLSYVIWQEVITPFLIVELLSPRTEAEDLGKTVREVGRPPTKWEIYERLLRIPYYVVFDRYVNQLRVFTIQGARYHESTESQHWFEEIQLGLKVWEGQYEGVEGKWLRWYDATDQLIPTRVEQAEQERQQAEQERQRAEQERQRAEGLAARLRELGIDPDEV